jgi:hypothetical protein
LELKLSQIGKRGGRQGKRIGWLGKRDGRLGERDGWLGKREAGGKEDWMAGKEGCAAGKERWVAGKEEWAAWIEVRAGGKEEGWLAENIKSQLSICGRAANLTNYLSPQISRFAEYICRLPTFAKIKHYEHTYR